MTRTTGRKNRKPAMDVAQQSKNAKRDFLERLTRARAERERLAERQRSEESAAAVELYRAERARAIKKGVPVAPTIDEYRDRVAIKATAIGDLAS